MTDNDQTRDLVGDIARQLQGVARVLPCSKCGDRGVAFLQVMSDNLGGYCAACMVELSVIIASENGVLPPVEILAGIMQGLNALADDAEREGGFAVEVSTVQRFIERHPELNAGESAELPTVVPTRRKNVREVQESGAYL